MPDMTGIGYLFVVGFAALVGLVLGVLIASVGLLFGLPFAETFGWVMAISVGGSAVVAAIVPFR